LITLKNIERFGGFREDRSKTFSGVCKDGSSAGPNDVLMAVTDMTKERRLVGHVAMVPDTYDKAQFSMDLIRLKGKLVSNSFLYAMLRYSTYADEFAVRASGANVLHLKPSSLDDCEVVVPKRGLREKFDFVFVPMTQKKNALYRAILRLTEARDRLLPKLMSGEIEV
jgi:type I restriction enzyme S subunit